MTTIQQYVEEQLEKVDTTTLRTKLGVSASMVSLYKKSYNPSLDVAKKVYEADNIVLHPFSEESLIYEIEKYKKD